MNINYIEKLRKISTIPTTDFSKCREDCENRLNISTGQGQTSAVWWAGIFNYEFYKEVLGITNANSVSASHGHYIGYLFDEDKKFLYLSLNQASADLSSKGVNHQYIKDLFNFKRTVETVNYENQILRILIPKRTHYISHLHHYLSKNNGLGGDYEIGSIYAIQYDLSIDIPDERFHNDLVDMLEDFEIIKAFYIEHGYNSFLKEPIENDMIVEDSSEISNDSNSKSNSSSSENRKYKNRAHTKSEQYQNDVNKTFTGLTKEQLDSKNNRKVEYTTDPTSHKKVAKRDVDLAKDVLYNADYQCAINPNHISFLTPYRHPYAEAHHLIPMSKQVEFPDFNIDRSSNITCLCANCHKAVHHGDDNTKIKILRKLYNSSEIKNEIVIKTYATDFDSFIEKFYRIGKNKKR